MWFEPDVDWMVVATPAARQRALAQGVAGARVECIGHPIHPRVPGLVGAREALRRRYGWTDQRVVLVTGGGGGVGIRASLREARRYRATLVVNCGRDEALRRDLQGTAGVQVLGFVDDLPERMCAADLVLTKAGPSTLAECRAVGTPVVVTAHMPGQENGNLDWVEDEGFGAVAETPSALHDVLEHWLTTPDGAPSRSAVTDRPGRDAASRIADGLLALAARVRRAHTANAA